MCESALPLRGGGGEEARQSSIKNEKLGFLPEMGKKRDRENIGGCRWLFLFGGMASKKTHKTQILASCLTGAQDVASKEGPNTPGGGTRSRGSSLSARTPPAPAPPPSRRNPQGASGPAEKHQSTEMCRTVLIPIQSSVVFDKFHRCGYSPDNSGFQFL